MHDDIHVRAAKQLTTVHSFGQFRYTYWLQNEARGDVADFLTFLDVENLERDSTSILRSVINEVDANHALRNGPVGASLFNPATPFFERHPSGGALSVEKSFLCRLVCEHLHSAEGADSDRLEAVRPSMLDVSELLEATLAEDSISNEFVVRQVLLTVPYLDMQDESGRRQMVLQVSVIVHLLFTKCLDPGSYLISMSP